MSQTTTKIDGETLYYDIIQFLRDKHIDVDGEADDMLADAAQHIANAANHGEEEE